MKTKDDVFNHILEKVLPDMDDVDYDPGDVIMRVRDICYRGLQIKETPDLKYINEIKERIVRRLQTEFPNDKWDLIQVIIEDHFQNILTNPKLNNL